ncbi:hypothetical protein GGI18_006561, partial [Coemansia linderi]
NPAVAAPVLALAASLRKPRASPLAPPPAQVSLVSLGSSSSSSSMVDLRQLPRALAWHMILPTTSNTAAVFAATPTAPAPWSPTPTAPAAPPRLCAPRQPRRAWLRWRTRPLPCRRPLRPMACPVPARPRLRPSSALEFWSSESWRRVTLCTRLDLSSSWPAMRPIRTRLTSGPMPWSSLTRTRPSSLVSVATCRIRCGSTVSAC